MVTIQNMSNIVFIYCNFEIIYQIMKIKLYYLPSIKIPYYSHIIFNKFAYFSYHGNQKMSKIIENSKKSTGTITLCFRFCILCNNL